jgi:electron transfer flavoprotein alpha/beta subunit
VRPQLAEGLHIPFVCYADWLKLKGAIRLFVERNVDDFFEKMETTLPSLVTI